MKKCSKTDEVTIWKPFPRLKLPYYAWNSSKKKHGANINYLTT